MKITISFDRREATILVVLLFSALVVKVLFFPLPGCENDLSAFESWFNTAATYGPRVFYNVVNWVDYPPFNIYIFWVFGSIAESLSLFGSSLMAYIIKLPPTLFDLATSVLIFIFVRKRSDLKMALIATALYAFNPAVIFNVAIWGQFDAIYTFFLILSLLLFFESRPRLAAVAFMLGILTKPQSIALAPLLVFLIFRKYNWRGVVTSLGAAIVTVFAVILPLEWTDSNPITFLSDIYFGAYSTYDYTSINAFNIWGFGGMWKPDTTTFLFINLYTLGWIMFGALVAFTLYFVYKRLGVSEELVILFSAFLLFFGFFMLPTRIHERYLFPALSVMALLIPFVKKMRPVYSILSGTYLINQAYVLSFLNAKSFIADGDPVVLIVSLINLVVLEYVLLLTWRALKGNKWLSSSSTGTSGN
ncbi:MAG: glycosyltransferase family 39 protein [Candidatus Bathyarchaeum sp.]|nr:MAG: glycosyltransferase family 39 protein [Candidatus Bathyarchaeum sp.]